MALRGAPGKEWLVKSTSPEAGGLSSRKGGSHGPPLVGSTLTPLPQQDEDAEAMWSMPFSRPHDKKRLKHGHCNLENVWQPTRPGVTPFHFKALLPSGGQRPFSLAPPFSTMGMTLVEGGSNRLLFFSFLC